MMHSFPGLLLGRRKNDPLRPSWLSICLFVCLFWLLNFPSRLFSEDSLSCFSLLSRCILACGALDRGTGRSVICEHAELCEKAHRKVARLLYNHHCFFIFTQATFFSFHLN